MPTYDYRCDACGHAFEEFQSMTAAPLKKCPSCGKSKLQRLIGIGAGIIFKGGGFYETDYRSDSYKKAAEAEKTAGKPAEKPDSSAPGGEKKADGASTPPAGEKGAAAASANTSASAEKSDSKSSTSSDASKSGGAAASESSASRSASKSSKRGGSLPATNKSKRK